MNSRIIATGVVVTVMVCISASFILSRRHDSPHQQSPANGQQETRQRLPAVAVESPSISAVNSEPSAGKNVPAPEPAVAPKQSQAQSKNAAADAQSSSTPQIAGSGKRNKPPIQDPDAREALALVGMNSEAEAYWFNAVNDPSLPPEERKDLIEDLNEDGLSDPKHPGPQDLAVVLRRMQILEEMEPMDQVNADAIEEAYKDLVNLAKLAAGVGGKPVN